MADSIDYFGAAATLTAALIQHKPDSVEVTPADAARLFWQMREALIAAAPKGGASVKPLRG